MKNPNYQLPTTKLLLFVALAVFLAPNYAFSQNSGADNPLTAIKVASADTQAVYCLNFGPILAENHEIPEIEPSEGASGTLETVPSEGASGAQADLEACQAALERAVSDPPDIPIHGLLSSMPWFRELPPWARVMISGSASAVIFGGMIYIGTLNPQ